MQIEVSPCSTECGLICVRIGNQTSCLSLLEAQELLAKLTTALNADPPP